jgi:hypothetical protein
MADNQTIQEVTKKTNYMPVGRSGTLVTGYVVQNDYIYTLQGTQAQELFYKMLLSDSQIRKVYHAVSNPIRSAVWDIEAASDETKDIEAAALIRHILFNDISFKSKLDEILTFPWHGHAVFEVIYKNRYHPSFKEYTGLAALGFRDQRTLDRWHFNSEGELEKIHQLQHGDIEVNVDMMADTLLIFYNERKGSDTGFPFCRMLYGNYKRKLLYKELQAIGIERAAIPVPHLELPPGVDYESSEYEDAVEQLAAFTQAEQAYFITPNGYTLNYNQTATFDPSKTQSAIKAENEEIVGSLIAMFLEMGIGGNSGNQAGVSISADFFKDGIEYIADNIADKINLELIPKLIHLNFPEGPEVMPKLIHAGIADEAGKELMEVVTGYVNSKVITADEPLEDHIRKAHNLPKKAEGEMVDNQEASNEIPDPNTNPPNDEPMEEDANEEELELSEKGKPKTPRTLINAQANKISDSIRSSLDFAAAKYINDVLVRYRQLPKDKKQKATDKVKIAGASVLRKDLKRNLTESAMLSIEMAKSEIPTKKDIELNNYEKDMLRMEEKYGEISHIKLNEFSNLPTYIQVLIQKQSELISEDSLNDLKKRIDFSFSSIETKSSDEAIIKQAMEEEAANFSASNSVATKGVNSASLMVNEGRDAFFFEPDVLEEIHSFTFMNIAPKSAICKELAGTTFNTNDAESLRYSPPLHHNCKSYLRANLKTSKGVSSLNVSTLSPSAKAKKSITL